MELIEPEHSQGPVRPASSKAIQQRRQTIGVEIVLILVGAVAVWIAEGRLDLLDKLAALGVPVVAETITTIFFLCIATALFAFRRWREAQVEAGGRLMLELAWRSSQSELQNHVRELFAANEALQAEVAQHKRAEESLTQSEEFNRRLVAASPIGILLLDHETRITYENPVMGQMMGVPAGVVSPAIGRKLLELPPVQAALPGAAAQALLAGEPIRGQVIHYHSLLGQETDLELYSAPLSTGPGSPEGTVLMLVDVTRRLAAEVGLRTSEQRYRSLFDDAPIAFWAEDMSRVKRRLEALRREGISDFRAYLASRPEVVAACAGEIAVIDINKAALKLYQAASLEEITQHSQSVFGSEFQDRFITELVAIADGQTEYHWEGAQSTLAGNPITVDMRWAPLPGFEESLGHVVVSMLDITERQQAETDLKHRLAELEAVSRISTALRTAQTLDDMLPLLIDETLSILGGTAGGVWLDDPAHDEVRLAVERGWGNNPPGPVKRGQGIAGQVVATGEPYRSRELRSDPQVLEANRALIPAGLGGICVPIRAAQEIIGALYVNTQLPHEFTAADAHLLTTLAEIAGNAIHRTTLHQQTERRLRQLTALSEIDRAIASGVELRLSLATLLTQLGQQLTVDASDVLVYNQSSQTLEYTAGQGFRTPAFARAVWRLGEGNAGRAAVERQTLCIPNLGLQPDEPRLAHALSGEAFVSYYGVPLIAKGKIQGVLEVFQRAALEPDQEWLDFLNALAGQAALAIDNSNLFESLQRTNTQLGQAYDATIEGWSRALDLRDQETEGHTLRVTDMTVQLARHFGLDDDDLIQVRWGALLHDIGKMGVPDSILRKPGPLTAEEWVVMKQHPALAYELLAPIRYLRAALDIPYCHHEKWDGSGYPRGLKGDQIPLSARVFALVDVWDALCSDRPYRPAWPEDKVREHIRSLSGTHFDPQLVSATLESGVLVGHPRGRVAA